MSRSKRDEERHNSKQKHRSREKYRGERFPYNKDRRKEGWSTYKNHNDTEHHYQITQKAATTSKTKIHYNLKRQDEGKRREPNRNTKRIRRQSVDRDAECLRSPIPQKEKHADINDKKEMESPQDQDPTGRDGNITGTQQGTWVCPSLQNDEKQKRTREEEEDKNLWLEGHLDNTNNTCYFNAALRFLQGLLPYMKDEQLPFVMKKQTNDVLDMIAELNQNRTLNVNKIVENEWKNYAPNSFQDAREIVRKILDDMGIPVPRIKQEYICSNCDTTITNSTYLDPAPLLLTKGKNTSIRDMVEDFEKQEQFKVDYMVNSEPAGKCAECRDNIYCIDKKVISTKPNILVFTMNKQGKEEVKMENILSLNNKGQNKTYRLYSWISYKNAHFTTTVGQGREKMKYFDYDKTKINKPEEKDRQRETKDVRLVCYVEESLINRIETLKKDKLSKKQEQQEKHAQDKLNHDASMSNHDQTDSTQKLKEKVRDLEHRLEGKVKDTQHRLQNIENHTVSHGNLLLQLQWSITSLMGNLMKPLEATNNKQGAQTLEQQTNQIATNEENMQQTNERTDKNTSNSEQQNEIKQQTEANLPQQIHLTPMPERECNLDESFVRTTNNRQETQTSDQQTNSNSEQQTEIKQQTVANLFQQNHLTSTPEKESNLDEPFVSFCISEQLTEIKQQTGANLLQQNHSASTPESERNLDEPFVSFSQTTVSPDTHTIDDTPLDPITLIEETQKSNNMGSQIPNQYSFLAELIQDSQLLNNTNTDSTDLELSSESLFHETSQSLAPDVNKTKIEMSTNKTKEIYKEPTAKETTEITQKGGPSVYITLHHCSICTEEGKHDPLYKKSEEKNTIKLPSLPIEGRCKRFALHIANCHPNVSKGEIDLGEEKMLRFEVDREKKTWWREDEERIGGKLKTGMMDIRKVLRKKIIVFPRSNFQGNEWKCSECEQSFPNDKVNLIKLHINTAHHDKQTTDECYFYPKNRAEAVERFCGSTLTHRNWYAVRPQIVPASNQEGETSIEKQEVIIIEPMEQEEMNGKEKKKSTKCSLCGRTSREIERHIYHHHFYSPQPIVVLRSNAGYYVHEIDNDAIKVQLNKDQVKQIMTKPIQQQ